MTVIADTTLVGTLRFAHPTAAELVVAVSSR
jgi:hypothetical protein